MSTPVKKIVIVGGGAAGWITAGVIAAEHDAHLDTGVDVILVESPDVATIGVGEGTWPTMRTTLGKLGISETDFIRDCDASFKQGTRFDRWHTGAEDDVYYHPFTLPQGLRRLTWRLVGWRGATVPRSPMLSAFKASLCERHSGAQAERDARIRFCRQLWLSPGRR